MTQITLPNFEDVLIPSSDEKCDWYIVPKGTKLYKWFCLSKRSDIFDTSACFHNFGAACLYAFGSELCAGGDLGFVGEVELGEDLQMLDVNSRRTLDYLKSLNPPATVNEMDLIDYCFGYQNDYIRRFSHAAIDSRLYQWLSNEGFNGFATKNIRGFHSECIILKKDTKLEYTGRSYRYAPFIDRDSILEVDHGSLTGRSIKVEDIKFRYGTREGEIRRIGTARWYRYQRDPEDEDDEFLFDPQYEEEYQKYIASDNHKYHGVTRNQI